MQVQRWIGGQLRKRKELLYNLGAISSYASMLTFFWHGVGMLMAKEHPKHTLVVYAALTFFTIVVMAPYKWDKKWMRIKTSVACWCSACPWRSTCSAGLCIDETPEIEFGRVGWILKAWSQWKREELSSFSQVGFAEPWWTQA